MDDASKRLRQLRDEWGISQKEMAQRMCVSLRAYQNYEAHERVPKITDVSNLTKFGVDLHWLLTGEGSSWRQDGAFSSPVLEVDAALMGKALEAVKAAYVVENARLPSERAAGELAACIYSEVAKLCVDPSDEKDQDAALHLAVSQLRRDLRSTDPAVQNKRRG